MEEGLQVVEAGCHKSGSREWAKVVTKSEADSRRRSSLDWKQMVEEDRHESGSR